MARFGRTNLVGFGGIDGRTNWAEAAILMRQFHPQIRGKGPDGDFEYLMAKTVLPQQGG